MRIEIIQERFKILSSIRGFPRAMNNISRASKELSQELKVRTIFSPQLFNLAYLLGIEGFISYDSETGEPPLSVASPQETVLKAFPAADIRALSPTSVNQNIYRNAYLLKGAKEAMQTLFAQADLDARYEASEDFQAAAGLLKIL